MMHSSICRPGTPEDSQPLSRHPARSYNMIRPALYKKCSISTSPGLYIFENLQRLLCALQLSEKNWLKIAVKK